MCTVRYIFLAETTLSVGFSHANIIQGNIASSSPLNCGEKFESWGNAPYINEP